ncbi:MAG: GNAT family N-acetyltransferase [Rubrivivax sp.]
MHAAANVTLREVTADTVRAVCQLVAEPPGFVAPNAVSIAQAYFHREAWFRAIYAGEQPVGFVMLSDPSLLPDAPADPQVFLWRFMVDRAHKGRGIGSAALRLVIGHVRARHPALARLGTSCVPGVGSPRPFYERLGFRFDGELDDGEEVLWLDLQPQRA